MYRRGLRASSEYRRSRSACQEVDRLIVNRPNVSPPPSMLEDLDPVLPSRSAPDKAAGSGDNLPCRMHGRCFSSSRSRRRRWAWSGSPGPRGEGARMWPLWLWTRIAARGTSGTPSLTPSPSRPGGTRGSPSGESSWARLGCRVGGVGRGPADGKRLTVCGSRITVRGQQGRRRPRVRPAGTVLGVLQGGASRCRIR